MRIILILLCVIPALAQVESVKFKYGDDMRWADPAFDDSAWMDGAAQVTLDGQLRETWQWARYKVRVPERFLDLSVGAVIPMVEVYVEGRLIGGSGRLPPHREDGPLGPGSWRIPADLTQPGRLLTVALRIWRFPGADLRRVTTLNAAPALNLHNAGEAPLFASGARNLVRGRVWVLVVHSLLLLLLVMSGPARWTRTEFQLLAGYLVSYILDAASFICGAYLPFGARAFAVTVFLRPVTYSLQLELLAHFAGVRPAWWLRAVQALNFLFYVPIGWAVFETEAPAWLPVIGLSWSRALIVNLAAALVVAVSQRAPAFSARLLPLSLTGFFGLISSVAGNGRIDIGDTTLTGNVLGHLLFGALVVGVQLYRLRESSRVAMRLEGQFAAARGMQEMLLLGNPPPTPGYAVDSIYRPADEVGGDFFHVLPAADGATLLAVGDVSGKGLRAAMVVSVITGILRNRRAERPGELLAEMNRALAGSMDGGFVTAAIASFGPDGRVVFANAGNPAPYLAGSEVDADGGLPLGIMRDAEYVERECTVRPGDQWTFVSDGVVEAANARGELFGFERTREISTKSAREIAEAAGTWGQNDDITVVTVRRSA